MAAKLETLQVRLPPDLLMWIDTWRAEQPARPSRSETIRWLLGVGVAVETRVQGTASTRVRFTDDA
jgi:hypothetical protein